MESCGQCPACKFGTGEVTAYLERIASGQGDEDDVELIGARLATVTDANRCYLGTQEQRVIASLMREFPEDFVAHLERGTVADPIPTPKLVALVGRRRHLRPPPGLEAPRLDLRSAVATRFGECSTRQGAYNAPRNEPWDRLLRGSRDDPDAPDPVPALAAARAELGDTFVVESGRDRYLFVFSPDTVRELYAVPESVASKGLADYRMLLRKLPKELFAERRTFADDLFGAQDVEGYLGHLDTAITRQIDELGDEGTFDVFALARRLGHGSRSAAGWATRSPSRRCSTS